MFNPKKLSSPSTPPTPSPCAPIPTTTIKLSNREILLENYVESAYRWGRIHLVSVFNSWLKTTCLHKALDKGSGVNIVTHRMNLRSPPGSTAPLYTGLRKNHRPSRPLSLLADLIGPDLQRLDNELLKLSLYQPDNPAITAAAASGLSSASNTNSRSGT